MTRQNQKQNTSGCPKKKRTSQFWEEGFKYEGQQTEKGGHEKWCKEDETDTVEWYWWLKTVNKWHRQLDCCCWNMFESLSFTWAMWDLNYLSQGLKLIAYIFIINTFNFLKSFQIIFK